MTTPAAVPATKKRQTISEKYADLRQTLEMVNNNREMLAEALSNAVLMLRQEDAGWAVPGQSMEKAGLTLKELQGWSSQIRTSLTGTGSNAPNPHMRNGLMLRHSFVWQGDMHYESVPGDPTGTVRPKQGARNIHRLMHDGDNGRLVFSKSSRRHQERPDHDRDHAHCAGSAAAGRRRCTRTGCTC